MKQLLSNRKTIMLVGALVLALLAVCVAAVVPKAADDVEQGSADSSVVAPEDNPANHINPQQTPDSSFLYDTSISSLMTADSYMDGQTVQVVGEVVGDRLRDEGSADFCWISLQSPNNPNDTVFVYLSRTLTQNIDTYGAYGKHGTMLQVRGTFNLACDEHEGLSDLHADHASVVHKGTVEPDSFKPITFLPGLLLLAFAGGLFLLFHRVRESNR